jgi:hypothetical protein
MRYCRPGPVRRTYPYDQCKSGRMKPRDRSGPEPQFECDPTRGQTSCALNSQCSLAVFATRFLLDLSLAAPASAQTRAGVDSLDRYIHSELIR